MRKRREFSEAVFLFLRIFGITLPEPGAKLLSPLHVLQRAEVRKEGEAVVLESNRLKQLGSILEHIWDTHPYHSNGSPSMFQG